MYFLTRVNHSIPEYIYVKIEIRKFVVLNPGRRRCDGSTRGKRRVKPHTSDDAVTAGDYKISSV